MKNTLSIFLSLLISLGAFACFGARAAVTVTDKTLRVSTCKTYTVKKSESKQYFYTAKNNGNKYISVKFRDNGSTCALKITAKKVTAKKLPIITLFYNKSDGKTVNVSSYRFTVKPAKKLRCDSFKLNVNTSQDVTLRNPYIYEYSFKSSEEGIVKLPTKCKKDGKHRVYSFKALKKGSTTVSVYIKGVKDALGSFDVTVGNYKTIIDPEYKSLRLKYNSHGSSTYMTESNFNISDILKYKHADAEYYTMTDNDGAAAVVSDNIIYATGKGSATATVYQTKNKKTTVVGKIKIKTVKAPLSYVVEQNAAFYSDVIFGHGDNTEFLELEGIKTVSLKPVIHERLLINNLTGSRVTASKYTITYKSLNTKVAKVSSSGKVTAVKKGKTQISFVINFTDKSTYKHYCKIIVE